MGQAEWWQTCVVIFTGSISFSRMEPGMAFRLLCSVMNHSLTSTCTWTQAIPGWQYWILLRDDSFNFVMTRMRSHDEISLITSDHGASGFNINVRELFCIALAVTIWSAQWRESSRKPMLHVRAWSDNASAVDWVNALSSNNPLAQELIRTIGLFEAIHRFRISARHIPGVKNLLADAGSRAWTEPHLSIWTNNASSWTQAPVPPYLRKIYSTFSTIYRPQHWPRAAARNMRPRGDNGALGATFMATHPGSPAISGTTPSRSCFSPLHAGDELHQHPEMLPPPFCPTLGIFHGIIAGIEILRQLRAQCNFSNAHDRVLWGATVVGFFFLLRRFEYLADRSATKTYTIQRRDVSFMTNSGRPATTLHEATAVAVQFRGGKTDQTGIGTSRTLERSISRWLCPVLAAWALMEEGTRRVLHENDLLCSISTTRPMTCKAMTTAIKTAATGIGEDPRQYGTHSMRSGSATAMFAAGVDRLVIKHFGRWSSDCFDRYARIDGITIAALSARMAAGDKQHTSNERQGRYVEGVSSTPHPGWSTHNAR